MSNKLQEVELRERWSKSQYPLPILAWESELGYDALRNVIKGRFYSEKSYHEIIRLMGIYDVDRKKQSELPLENLLLEPIRTLHLGRVLETALIEADITHIFALVKLTPIEIVEKTTLGIAATLNIAKSFGPRLEFGMDVKDYSHIKAVFNIEMRGSYPDIAAAVSSVNRHLYSRVGGDYIEVSAVVDIEEDRLKPKKAIDKARPPKGSKGNHPFQFKMTTQCQDSKLELRHRRYRGVQELQAKIREFADRLDGIKTVRDWENSDAWSVDL